jgi:putative ABC transport system substrate-binding protein
MNRRDFIALLGGAAAWPLAARAQQGGLVRRIGVLSSWSEDDPLERDLLSTLQQELHKLGWTEGRNLRIDAAPLFSTVGHAVDDAVAVIAEQ